MQIEIKYFASLREQVGKSNEVIETNAKTGEELYQELQTKYQLKFNQKHIRLAINEEYANFSSELKSNDVVAFIPPVAGG